MNGTKVIIWATAIVVLLGGCATTEPRTSRQDYQALCAALDKERKGYVTKEEFVTGAKDKQQAARLFQLCDTNQDERLNFEEYQRQQRMINNIFELQPPPQVVPRR